MITVRIRYGDEYKGENPDNIIVVYKTRMYSRELRDVLATSEYEYPENPPFFPSAKNELDLCDEIETTLTPEAVFGPNWEEHYSYA
jgi:hypothetical protein